MSSEFWNIFSLDRIPSSFRKPLFLGLLAGVVAAAFSHSLPNRYRSEARILPADSRSEVSSMGQMAAAAAAFGVVVPGQDSADVAFVDIVNSRWTAQKILTDNYNFHTKSWYFGRSQEHQESLDHYLKARNPDQGFRKMAGILSAKRDTKTKLLTISAETPSPELSQQIVQKAVGILENFIRVKTQTRGGNKAAFTAERLKEAQMVRDQVEQEFQAFLDVHRNYVTSNEPAVRLKGGRLEATLKLRQQVVTTLTLNYEQALLEEKNDMPILNVLDQGHLPNEKSGPSRSKIVVLAFFLTFAVTWGWVNREWIRDRLFISAEDEEPNPSNMNKEFA